MPHATSETMPNGDQQSSKTLSHLTSYPAVSDGIETFKQHPYGRKSLEIIDSAYSQFGKPVEPYLQTPYSYAKPYVSKADELGDKALDSVDGRFPIVKEDTTTVVETAKGYLFWPYTYVTDTWSDEYRKVESYNNRGPGITTTSMAMISTELRILSDVFQYIADRVRPAYEESKQKGAEYVRLAQEKADATKQGAQDTLNDYSKAAQDKVEQLKGDAHKSFEQGKQDAAKGKEEAQKKMQK